MYAWERAERRPLLSLSPSFKDHPVCLTLYAASQRGSIRYPNTPLRALPAVHLAVHARVRICARGTVMKQLKGMREVIKKERHIGDKSIYIDNSYVFP